MSNTIFRVQILRLVNLVVVWYLVDFFGIQLKAAGGTVLYLTGIKQKWIERSGTENCIRNCSENKKGGTVVIKVAWRGPSNTVISDFLYSLYIGKYALLYHFSYKYRIYVAQKMVPLHQNPFKTDVSENFIQILSYKYLKFEIFEPKQLQTTV